MTTISEEVLEQRISLPQLRQAMDCGAMKGCFSYDNKIFRDETGAVNMNVTCSGLLWWWLAQTGRTQAMEEVREFYDNSTGNPEIRHFFSYDLYRFLVMKGKNLRHWERVRDPKLLEIGDIIIEKHGNAPLDDKKKHSYHAMIFEKMKAVARNGCLVELGVVDSRKLRTPNIRAYNLTLTNENTFRQWLYGGIRLVMARPRS